MQIGYYFQNLLGSIFAPLVFEAAKSLLELCALKHTHPESAATLVVGTAWAPQAVASLMQLWKGDSGPSIASHTHLLDLIASNIRNLPVSLPCVPLADMSWTWLPT